MSADDVFGRAVKDGHVNCGRGHFVPQDEWDRAPGVCWECRALKAVLESIRMGPPVQIDE